MKIVFMGTPEFAVASLEKIHHSHHEIVMVVTTPDKPAGRGLKLKSSAVKNYALEHGLPLMQPEKLKDKDVIASLGKLQADVFVVVAFRMLPKEIFTIPPKGCFNLHASLLPQYRGAAPINWAVINGETETGLTTFLIDEQIDTGKILEQEKVLITPEDTAGTLHDKMMPTGADLVIETLNKIEKGTIKVQSQQQLEIEPLHSAPKLTKLNTKLDFNQPAHRVIQTIKGLNPYPAAYFELENIGTVKVYSAQIGEKNDGNLRNCAFSDRKKVIKIPCKDYFIELNEIQTQGKKKMTVSEYLRGNPFLPKTLIISG